MGVPQAQGSMLRRAALGTAFLFATAMVQPALADDEEPGESGGAAEPAAASEGAAATDGASGKPSRKKRSKSRRSKGGKFAGRVVAEEDLRTEPLPRPSGNLEIQSLADKKDRAKVNIYNPDGSYSIDAVEELNHVLRCRRTDAEIAIDIQLLTWMSLIYDHFGGKPLQIVSGFRNQRKQTSNHFKGRATDIRIEGVTAQAGPRVRPDAGSGWDGHRPLSAGPVRPHRRPLAAQLPVDRQLAGEFERRREAPAARLEAQEARELTRSPGDGSRR